MAGATSSKLAAARVTLPLMFVKDVLAQQTPAFSPVHQSEGCTDAFDASLTDQPFKQLGMRTRLWVC